MARHQWGGLAGPSSRPRHGKVWWSAHPDTSPTSPVPAPVVPASPRWGCMEQLPTTWPPPSPLLNPGLGRPCHHPVNPSHLPSSVTLLAILTHAAHLLFLSPSWCLKARPPTEAPFLDSAACSPSCPPSPLVPPEQTLHGAGDGGDSQACPVLSLPLRGTLFPTSTSVGTYSI